MQKFGAFYLASKLRAAAITSEFFARASWNIWQYMLLVVPTQECPISPDTATTSTPALISKLACK